MQSNKIYIPRPVFVSEDCAAQMDEMAWRELREMNAHVHGFCQYIIGSPGEYKPNTSTGEMEKI
ncbi:MAG: hypothetical protein ACN2B6_00320 [Rickettsiales bacterium]